MKDPNHLKNTRTLEIQNLCVESRKSLRSRIPGQEYQLDTQTRGSDARENDIAKNIKKNNHSSNLSLLTIRIL